MKKRCRVLAVAALAAGLSACQGGAESAGEPESPAGGVAPDRPAPSISDPASPAPVGTDVGSVQRDTSAGRVANDSVAIPGQ